MTRQNCRKWTTTDCLDNFLKSHDTIPATNFLLKSHFNVNYSLYKISFKKFQSNIKISYNTFSKDIKAQFIISTKKLILIFIQ